MINNDIGFVLIKLDNDPKQDQILQTIKNFEINNPTKQVIIFNSVCNKINTYNLPILHLSQSQFFYGSLVIFDLPSIILSKDFPNLKKRILYTDSTPWEKNPHTRYEEWNSLYNQSSLDIVTANERLYNIYNICWKKPLGIAENFNYETFSHYL